ncbi:hypothetical protein LMG28727_03485 [Paraburkholderia kirstenboschensis]|nr:hypothetical protein LMG28727_03485 [Paraburkholderia kirstenboschensis]
MRRRATASSSGPAVKTEASADASTQRPKPLDHSLNGASMTVCHRQSLVWCAVALALALAVGSIAAQPACRSYAVSAWGARCIHFSAGRGVAGARSPSTRPHGAGDDVFVCAVRHTHHPADVRSCPKGSLGAVLGGCSDSSPSTRSDRRRVRPIRCAARSRLPADSVSWPCGRTCEGAQSSR